VNEEKSTQARLLLAVVLSIAVMALWGILFPPPKSPQTPPTPPPVAAGKAEPAKAPAEAAAPPVISKLEPVAPRAAAEEKIIVVENDLYRVEFSNRGGVVRSWKLKKFIDDAKPPHVLDVVHPDAARQLGAWPLSLALADAELEKLANTELYEVTPPETSLRAPAQLAFTWSDGRLAVTKRLKFVSSYVVELDTDVQLEGKPLVHGVAWRGGFGDDTAYAAAEQVRVVFRAAGKTQALAHGKLGNPDNSAQRLQQEGALEYSGIEDRYFAAAFLPRNSGGVALWHWKLERDATRKNKVVKEPVAEMAAGTASPAPLAVRLYVGPKELEELGRITPPLTDLVDFGWFGLFARPLFYFLKWLHNYVQNYGWAIVLLTIIINTVLFPLKVKSWRSMQKMQKVQPEVKAIQDKYKKYSMRDPRKQEMNKEMMAVYQREGVSPMGGCLPMLIQMPIWFALYSMLLAAIELRHAPWILWIKDLSAPDPYYILPVVMAVTMYAMQKMTPVTTTDPVQQKMMNMMPIMFGAMFVFFPISSGLVLYILTSNVIGISQQWYLNRTSPLKPSKEKERERKK
jgi:YidC/Oxa1 family membrane protein insertase